MTQQQYVDLIKSALLTATRKAVMDYLVAQIPFLGWAFVNPIVGMIVDQILSIVFQQTELAAFFFYIDFRTVAQGKDFENAAVANQTAQTNGTPEQKAKAEQDLITAFRAFAKLTN